MQGESLQRRSGRLAEAERRALQGEERARKEFGGRTGDARNGTGEGDEKARKLLQMTRRKKRELKLLEVEG